VLPDLRAQIDWIEHAESDISATDIRQRAQHGLPLTMLVTDRVIAFLPEHQLYT
jgi:nicotinic acid mononucleotide adenylyltransferase